MNYLAPKSISVVNNTSDKIVLSEFAHGSTYHSSGIVILLEDWIEDLTGDFQSSPERLRIEDFQSFDKGFGFLDFWDWIEDFFQPGLGWYNRIRYNLGKWKLA